MLRQHPFLAVLLSCTKFLPRCLRSSCVAKLTTSAHALPLLALLFIYPFTFEKANRRRTGEHSGPKG